MASLKLFLASLGLGLCIPASVVVFILVLKIIFPGTTGIFLLWFFVWPMPFILRLVPDLAFIEIGRNRICRHFERIQNVLEFHRQGHKHTSKSHADQLRKIVLILHRDCIENI
jgi:hypothetical protein